MNGITALLVAAVLASTTGIAHANHDPEENWDGLGTALLVVGAIEIAPAALLAVDLVARPQSKVYGGVELAIGGSVALLNTVVAVDFYRTPNCSDCKETLPYFAAVIAVDLAAAAHGAYLLLRDEPPPMFELGSARGTFTPAMVSDGKNAAPGLSLGGTF